MLKQNAYKVLSERGFVYQCTNEEKLIELFAKEEVTAYIGFDITADSLHVGHMLPLMVLAWLDRTGHRPIALMGGGTTMIGDPSGRSEHRKITTREDIINNLKGIYPQAEKFISLTDGKAMMLDNSDWLLDLNLLEFLRDIGVHFSINRMLSAEAYKSRLEAGLTFFEFSYMLIQAYDFLVLHGQQNNKVQMGGQDQWGNIVAGIDLIRRVKGEEAYGFTVPLLVNPKTGEKFGKTNAGAVWLDKNKTSVYDFYQFWRNVDDEEACKLMNLFTFLPTEETAYYTSFIGSNFINRIKEILAYEVTALCHGAEEASQAYLTSIQTFGETDPTGEVKTSSKISNLKPEDALANLPSISVKKSDIENISLSDLFVLADLASSKSEARRLIRGGGAYANEQQVPASNENLPMKDSGLLEKNEIIIRFGKKKYKKVIISS